jgi:hypothetical protein
MMIEILLAIVCTIGGGCHADTITISKEAAAIAMCESGDTQTLGSVDWGAVNVNRDGSVDMGAFQFNSHWIWNPSDRWIMRPFANDVLGMSSDTLFHLWPTPNDAPPRVQVALFEYLWDGGRGWRHWAASRDCWDTYVNKGESI